MPFESNPEQSAEAPNQSAEPTPRSRRLGRLPRAVMVSGLAVGLALGGAGIAYAASSSGSSNSPSSSTPSTTPSPGSSRPVHGFRKFGGPLALGGLGRVLHGQFTTAKPGGGYETVDVQVGKVTSVSQASISLTSTDGYNHTYSVTSSTVVDSQRDGISSVSTGDQVQLAATTVSGTDTATNISDTTKVGASRSSFGFGFGPRGPGAPPAPGGPAA
jgi:hypothetical protein